MYFITPQDLTKNSGVAFGTSGLRGLVAELNAELCSAFVAAFLNVLKTWRIQLRSAILVVMRPSAKILQKRLNEVFYS